MASVIGNSISSAASVTSADVAPVSSVSAVPSPASDGQGQSLPQAGQSVPPPVSADQLSAAVDAINQFLKANARQFVFQLDSSSGKSRVTIVNPQTGDVVRQIPDPNVLEMAQNIGTSGLALTGLLVNSRA